jgi:hypothetical protein
MAKINNQTQNLFALDTVQDLDNETAATCSGGLGYLYGPNPDVILHKDPDSRGQSMGVNARTNDGILFIGSSDGKGGGLETTFNDTVSSITIKRGTWQFFDHYGYKGDTTGRLGPGTYNLGHNNDRISSVLRVAP